MNDDIAALVAHHREILRAYFLGKGFSASVPEPFARGANDLLYRFMLQGIRAVAKIGVNPFYRCTT